MPEYYCPDTVKDAVSLLGRIGNGKILAGGTDLMVHRRESGEAPAAYLDITHIPRLRTIAMEQDKLWIGAAVTFAEIERSQPVQTCCALLGQAAASVGSPQIRSCGTIGGNIANASPAADSVPALTALCATAELEGPDGVRCVPVEDLIIGMGKTIMKPGELLTGVYVPVLQPDARTAFDKIGRRKALAIARINGACVLRMREGIIQEARLCIGAVMNQPRRCTAAEALLQGYRPDDELFRQAGEKVRQMILQYTGMRSSSAYKLPVVVDFTQNLLKKACSEGDGQGAAALYSE